jgi:RHS repeat-associated protein
VRDVRWRGTVARRERRDGAGRLLANEATRVAGGAPLAALEQLADARGLPVARRLAAGAVSELSLLDVDRLARIVREARVPAGAAALGVAGLDSAGGGPLMQAGVDAAIAAARAGMPAPAPEEIALTFDPDGARRSRTARAGGAAVGTTIYARTPAGLAVATGFPRTQDADGLPRQAAGAQLAYDAWARIAAVDATVRVERDALGRPWRLTWAGSTLELVHDGDRVVEAHAAGGGVVRTIRVPGSPLVLELQDGVRRLHPLSDPDGTTHVLLDATGAMVARSGWDPWGERRAPSGAWPGVSETFHEMPPLAGSLLLAAVRTYDAASGAFLERDRAPLADGPNLHAFARGNPLAFTDPLGFMAQPGGAAGRGAPDGAFYGHGARRIDTWYLRSLAAMGGALWSIWGMISEPFKQVYDLGGAAAGWLAITTGLFTYEHRWASGIGQLAEQGNGTLDIGAAVGRSVLGTPGRVWDAAERGDYAGFGAEAFNLYTIGRPVALPVMRYGGNWGVYALGQFGGEVGQALRRNIRMRQIHRLAAQATRIRGPEGLTIRYGYGASRSGDFGTTLVPSVGAVGITIFERAFTPGLRDLFLAPSELGGVVGRGSWLSRLRYSIDNGLRGNLALRTMLHERWHAQQSLISPGIYDNLATWPKALYMQNPIEWTQGAGYAHIPFEGAFNSELAAPHTWATQAAASGQFSLLGAESREQR